jgi:hypothetical protein
MKIRRETVVAFVIYCISVQTSLAQVTNPIMENWSMLVSQPINYSEKRDSIYFRKSKEYFTALKFLVKNDPVKIQKCTVYFTDGTKTDVDCIGKSTENDGCIMDLFFNYQAIDKVLFSYDAKINSEEKALLEIWYRR